MISQCFLVSYQPSCHYSYTVSSTETTMGNCWSKEEGKMDFLQKRDRIKMWVESVSQPDMEVIELRSTPEQWGTKLVRTHAVSDI